MARQVKPGNDETVEEQGHRRRSCHRLRQPVRRVFQAEVLFAIFKSAFDGPAIRIRGQDLSNVPDEIRTVEHLVRPAAFQVASQDYGQQPLSACFVVEGLLRLDRERGVQAELVEGKLRPRFLGIVGPVGHARQTLALLAWRPLAAFGRRWRQSIQSAFGMDVTDEMNVVWQVRQNALATIGAVAGDDDGIAGKPGGGQVKQLDGQLRPGAMIAFGLGGLGVFLLALGQALAVAIEPHGDRQREDFGRRPKRMDDEQTQDDPVVSPTDQFEGPTSLGCAGGKFNIYKSRGIF